MEQEQKRSESTEDLKSKEKFFSTGRFWFGCLPLTILGIIFILAIIISFNPALPDPLPNYPGATRLTSTEKLPDDWLSSFCYSDEFFGGETYQAFATADDHGKIENFYLDSAQKRGFNFVGRESYATCYSHGSTALMFSAKEPTLAMRVFNWSYPQDAALIAQYFPLAPPKTNVILLIQGFKHRTLA